MLRPRALLEARDALAAGTVSSADFKRVEDEAVDDAVAAQEAAGLDVVTDGEMRRTSFQSQLTEAVEGFANVGLDAFLWGDWHGDDAVGGVNRPRPEGLGVTGTLRPRRRLSTEEFTYVRGRTSRIVKVTLPSPSLFASLWQETESASAYPTIESFLEDIARILRDEVAELVRLGCEYIHLDAPHYPLVLDPAWAGFYAARGWSAEDWVAYGIELDNWVMDGWPGVTFGFHLCKGNQGSRWLTEGGYDSMVDTVLRRVSAQRLLLEYDDERSGTFEPLRGVPDDKVVVLGLVTTKSGALERQEDAAGPHRRGGAALPSRAACAEPAVRLRHVGRRQQPHHRGAERQAAARRGDGATGVDVGAILLFRRCPMWYNWGVTSGYGAEAE